MNEGPSYEVNIGGQIHQWSKGISVEEITELGGFPPDSQMVAVDLADNSEQILPEDAMHEVVAREAGKPLVKRMSFKRF